jgi:hypothetical protein
MRPIPGLPLVIILFSGCASFHGDELPVADYSQIVEPGNKPHITYDATYEFQGKKDVETLLKITRQVFARSEYFATYVAEEDQGGYHVSLTMVNSGDTGKAVLSGFICGLTLFIIPAYAQDEFTLHAEVTKDGRLVKRYLYRDTMSTWVQVLLLFATPFCWPRNVADEVWENMVLSFMIDLSRDKILLNP